MAEDMRRIVLKGSKEQIDAAKSLILEKVQSVLFDMRQLGAELLGTNTTNLSPFFA